jgi:hypothetical protein
LSESEVVNFGRLKIVKQVTNQIGTLQRPTFFEKSWDSESFIVRVTDVITKPSRVIYDRGTMGGNQATCHCWRSFLFSSNAFSASLVFECCKASPNI